MQETELSEIEKLLGNATSAPWFVHQLDDDHAMCAVVISTADPLKPPVPTRDDWSSDKLVAATLIQAPRLVDVADKKWDENADLIAALRNNAAELIRLARIGLEAEKDAA
ncbi:MAG: hypothetical protein AAGG69_00920 [Pseudomonadota bacterium]